MSIYKGLHSLTRIGLVLLPFLLTACSTQVFDGKPINQSGVYVQSRFRSSLDTVYWDTEFSRPQRTVSVHKDDGGASEGSVTLQTEGATYGPRVGLLATIGPNPFRFVIGGDVRVNPMPDDDNFDDTDLHDRELQPLGFGYDSYGYALFDPDEYSYIPYVGIESAIGPLLIGLEYGRPYAEFTYERGHDRLNDYQIIEKDVWNGFGQSGSVRIGYIFSDDFGYLGLQYSKERYRAEFSGIDNEIDAHVISIIFEARF